MINQHSVLVVDDDSDIAINLSDILHDSGYRVDIANDGATALSLVDARQYGIVLVDFRMPDMNGAMLLNRIRERQAKVQAIMMTAFIGSEDVAAVEDAGLAMVLRKPIDVAELLTVIERLCGDSDSADESASRHTDDSP